MPPPDMVSNMFDRSFYSNGSGGTSALPLPLNMIALIISYLDQPSDLSRTCRTCRVFHYMTLPQLYASVSLRSYDYIRYTQQGGRPEGCGMASPFSMGLNSLATRNVAGYVKRFRIYGEWKERELEECAKVGRVPDASMMLNSLIKVAIDKMGVLDSFSWELETKMLPIVWQGIALSNLTQLTVKFPSTRYPQPITVVPPMPNLKALKILDIDPLCYVDDISLLLLGSKKLEDLKLAWSPRMKECREPSIHLSTYFGRILAANYVLPLKRVSAVNLYTHNGGSCPTVIDNSKVEEMTLINSTAGVGDDAASVFIDRGWNIKEPPEYNIMPNLKSIRTDKVSKNHAEFLGRTTGLEKIYLIGSQYYAKEQSNSVNGTSQRGSAFAFPNSPASSTSSSPSAGDATALKDDYLANITKNHGSTLRHLLLLPQWRLSADDVALIIKNCPNLEQLGVGVDFADFSNLRLLVPFLPKLKALRILDNPDDRTFMDKIRELDDGRHEERMGSESFNKKHSVMKWVEVGDLIFAIGESKLQSQAGKTGKPTYRKDVRRTTSDAVEHIAIWSMDCMEI